MRNVVIKGFIPAGSGGPAWPTVHVGNKIKVGDTVVGTVTYCSIRDDGTTFEADVVKDLLYLESPVSVQRVGPDRESVLG